MRVATDVVLGDRYRLEEQIAVGGMGEVWRALDLALHREVAVKILREEYAQDPTFHARFRGEARNAAGLSHGGIATVFDYGEADGGDGWSYLVMELVEGEPLSQLLVREAPLAPERALDIVGQTARALQAAHEAGVVHRDVKPGNLLIGTDGWVKVTDFGIARAADAVPMTRTGQVMGTAQYLSPEQAAGGSATPLSDVYALGVVAYECLAGRRPFDGTSPVGVALAQVRDEPPPLPDDVPQPVRALVLRMLAKDPAERPSSAAAVAEEAARLRAGLAAATAQTTLLPPVPDAGAHTVRMDAVPAGEPEAAQLRPIRRRLAPLWTSLALVGVIALLVLVRACSAPSDGQANPTGSANPNASAPSGTNAATGSAAGSASSPSQQATEPRFVTIREDRYRGRRAEVVVPELQALGLNVSVRNEEGDRRPGTVMDVSPTGRVAVGSTVTVTVEAPKGGGGGGGGKGKGKE